MTGRAAWFLIISILLISLLLRSPLLFVLDALAALVAGTSALWGRYCLSGVSYARRLGARRLFYGEETDLWVEIVNAKPLPLAWLKAEDEIPASVTVQRATLARAGDATRRTLVNLFSLRWYERVRRHYRLIARQRGVFEFGPALISSGDIFGFRTRWLEIPERQTMLVYPKRVPLEELGLRAARPFGDFGAERRLNADPLRLAGTRDYQPGDSVRHIHWKATARRGALQTKVFDPSVSQQLIIFLNCQTLHRAHEGVVGDYLETAIVVAASIAQAGLEAGHAVGLFTNGSAQDSPHRVRVPASRHAAQPGRVLETLAQLTHFTFLSFEDVLRVEAPQLPYGATVIAVSAVITELTLSALLDLRAAGHPAALVAIGQQKAWLQPPELPVYFVTQNWTELSQFAMHKA